MVQQHDTNKLKQALNHIFRILSAILCWLVICALILLVMLDYNTPGDLISWRLAFPIMIPTVLILILEKRQGTGKIRKVVNSCFRSSSLRLSKLKQSLLFGCFIIIVLVASIGYWQFTEAENRDFLRASVDHFVIDSHPDVSQGQEDSTAIELERAYRHLSSIVPEFSVVQPIKVRIYPNVSEMQRSTGRSANTAGFTWCSPDGPIIYIPAEQESSLTAGDYKTSTPGHEVVHAVVCEMVDTEFAGEIPIWFQEGLAEYESNLGWKRMMDRNSRRIFVSLHRADIMQYDVFSLYNPVISEDYDEIFYKSSFEFMRYIIGESARLAPWEITNLVNEGYSFDSAFQSVVGDSPSSMYEKWIDNFYGILD